MPEATGSSGASSPLLGVVGGGQLGRMLGLAGLPLGLRFRFLDPAPDACAGAVGEVIRGGYDEPAALERFALGLAAATYEFENVPAAAARWLAGRLPLDPPPAALAVAQDRLEEKRFFRRLGIPTAPFAPVDSLAGLLEALKEIPPPAILKTRRGGYDGKGQVRVERAEDAASAWAALGEVPGGAILEGLVAFEREATMVAVRGRDGRVVRYPLTETRHLGGVLHLALAPGLSPALEAEAEEMVAAAMEALGYVGALAVEFFVADGRLVANEMAPRVHNAGHWTIEGAATSQFENHLRAVMGWPLGETTVRGAAGMINLLGALPAPAALLALPDAHLHAYGKADRAGRKVGHLTLVAPDAEALAGRLQAALRALDPGGRGV